MEEAEAAAVAARALEAASGDGVEVLVQVERGGLARFAASEIHQPTLIENALVQLHVVRGGRSGRAVTNRLSDDALTALARRAEEAADSAPPDPHFPGLAPPAELPQVEGFDEGTAGFDPADLARLARTAIDAQDAVEVYGFATSGVTTIAVACSTGLSAAQQMTDATAVVLAAGDGISGYASATAWSAGGIDPAAVAREAAEKALRTRSAGEVPPATYRAVLEPYALAELLEYFAFDTFNGLGLLEDRSYFCARLGERVFDERVTIADDALDPRGLPKAFDFEGTPKERVPLVERGVARGVVWDRATAARDGGRVSTGHAPPLRVRHYGPFPYALSVEPGTAASLDELVELVGDGIYVTRLHYLSIVEPREGVITGMTRDGTFRIRDGRVAEPLVNLRFTVSVPQLLADVPALTRHVKLVNRSDFYDERYPHAALCPALATGHFTVTGLGSSPGL